MVWCLYRVGWCGRTCKGLLASCDNDCTDALVIVIGAQGFIELLEERRAEGVEGLGTVQSDCRMGLVLILRYHFPLETYSGQHRAWGSR